MQTSTFTTTKILMKSKLITNALLAVRGFQLSRISFRESSNMYQTIRPPLLLALMFGMFPVTSLWSKKSSNVRFKWISWQMFYFFATLVGQIFMMIMCTMTLMQKRFTLINSTNFIFYSSSIIGMLFNFSLAKKFNKLMNEIATIEAALPKRKMAERISLRCNILVLIVFLCAAVEHILSMLYALRVAYKCSPGKPALQAYFTRALPWVFDYVTYSTWKGILTEFFNIQATFMWSYIDIMIVILSIYLTSHFNPLNKFLLLNKNKMNTSWIDARLCYGRIAELVRLVDANFNLIVLVSFSSNLFFICLQLFNSLKHNSPEPECNGIKDATAVQYQSAYFTFSFCFLIARTLLVSLTAAGVHSSSRRAAVALYEVPSASYNKEVERFIDQVNNSTIALSGLNFFYVTRGMILTIVGTIITYELVLLQFNPSSKEYVESDDTSSPLP